MCFYSVVLLWPQATIKILLMLVRNVNNAEKYQLCRNISQKYRVAHLRIGQEFLYFYTFLFLKVTRVFLPGEKI